MTHDNKAIVTTVSRASGDDAPVTRAELAANVTEGIIEIIAAIEQASAAWLASEGDDAAALLAFTVGLTNHLAVQSIPLLHGLAQHDAQEDAIEDAILALGFSIPDVVEVTE